MRVSLLKCAVNLNIYKQSHSYSYFSTSPTFLLYLWPNGCFSLKFYKEKMGFLQCSLVSKSSDDQESLSSRFDSSQTPSLYSLPSLPSVPSLTPQIYEFSTNDNHCITTLKGHKSAVFSLTLAGKYLYSGASDNEIHVWDPNSSTIGYKVATCHSAVKSLVVLGDKLFTAHNDHKIRVWRINESEKQAPYKCIATLPTVNDRITSLFFSKNYIKVRRNKRCTWVHHVDAISALALTKDGSMLYSVSWDRTFKVWRTSDFKCMESTWNAHDDAINAIALSNDGFVYTGSADKKIKIWRRNFKKHELVDTLEKHKSSVNALALSDDGSVLYSGACDRSIIVWEKHGDGDGDGDGGGGGRMVVVGALRGHKKAILCLKVVGDLVLSGSADKSIRIWKRGLMDKSIYNCLGVLEGHREPVKCLSAAVDGCTSGINSGTHQVVKSYLVYSGSLDCDIKVWRIGINLEDA